LRGFIVERFGGIKKRLPEYGAIKGLSWYKIRA
jgi:hypothetical protein